MKTTRCLFLILLIPLLLAASLGQAAAENSSTHEEDLALAERYAPVLYFHPDEVFRPQTVDVLVENARLRQDVPWWFDVNILNQVTLPDLITYHDAEYFLDVWYGSKGASDYKNYSAHRDYYTQYLSPDAGGPPPTGYAHVVRDPESGKTVIQYWLFYYYNDWFNKHEGDWEFVQVILDQDDTPEWVVLSQHHGGTRRAWDDTQIEAESHPAVYVALGSHANYFWGEEIYPNGMDVGDSRVEILDRTGSAQPIIPEIRLLPEREQVFSSSHNYPLLEWLVFTGNWGEQAFQGDFGGPRGPADKGEQWDQAYQWGMDQPLDTLVWYQNRLRVEVIGAGAENTEIELWDEERLLDNTEQHRNPAVMHSDPPLDAEITARVENLPTAGFEVRVVKPVPKTEVVVYTFLFEGEPEGSSLAVTIPVSGTPEVISADGTVVSPTASTHVPAAWEAPDLVWFAGYLPAGEVLLGVLVSLAAGILPSLAYAAVLYWNDRYEREPLKLVAAALLWGAVPAVLVALAARLFFRLPPGLIGPQAVEAVQAGVLTPLIEELLKGAVVLLVAFRYRREFDNVLDGVIYGAMVGFGYTMTGSTISFLGAFLLRGFTGLGTTVMVEGILFGLNHAMYTAIFGAGLGYARLVESKSVKILAPIIAFLLAVGTNATHSLVVDNLVGFSPLTVLLNWMGIGVLILVSVWSLRRQRRVIEEELAGEIPDKLLKTLLDAKIKRISLTETKKQGGPQARQKLEQHYQLLAEYAFKKMQHRKFPGDRLGEELEALREEIQTYLQD